MGCWLPGTGKRGNGEVAVKGPSPHCILLQKQGQETDLQLIMFSHHCILRFFWATQSYPANSRWGPCLPLRLLNMHLTFHVCIYWGRIESNNCTMCFLSFPFRVCRLSVFKKSALGGQQKEWCRRGGHDSHRRRGTQSRAVLCSLNHTLPRCARGPKGAKV